MLQGDEIAESLRSFGKLGDKSPMLVVLDIPSEKKYVHPSNDLTKEAVEEVVGKTEGGNAGDEFTEVETKRTAKLKCVQTLLYPP